MQYIEIGCAHKIELGLYNDKITTVWIKSYTSAQNLYLANEWIKLNLAR